MSQQSLRRRRRSGRSASQPGRSSAANVAAGRVTLQREYNVSIFLSPFPPKHRSDSGNVATKAACQTKKAQQSRRTADWPSYLSDSRVGASLFVRRCRFSTQKTGDSRRSRRGECRLQPGLLRSHSPRILSRFCIFHTSSHLDAKTRESPLRLALPRLPAPSNSDTWLQRKLDSRANLRPFVCVIVRSPGDRSPARSAWRLSNHLDLGRSRYRSR